MKWLLLMLIAGCPVEPTPAPMPLPYVDPFNEHMQDCDRCGSIEGDFCQEAVDKYNELWEKHNVN